MTTGEILAELETYGILLTADPKLPSVCAMIAGEPVRGSWWADPQSHEMMRTLTDLAEHRDVLVAKLVNGKDTLIHRALWPAVLTIGEAREKWQMNSLDEETRSLLEKIDRDGELQTSGKSALQLERALLVYGEQVHTESGSHAKLLIAWKRWAQRAALSRVDRMDLAEARASLEKLLDYLNGRFGSRAKLPWA